MNSSKPIECLDDEAMSIYQYIVDNYRDCSEEMPEIIEKLKDTDTTGQFFASSAIYLAAIDREQYDRWLAPLIECVIEKDREHRYLGSLLTSIWGEEYRDNIEDLKIKDDNFRRIYKRLHPEENIM